MTKLKLTASLVLYNSMPDQFEAVISDFIQATPDGLLFVIDNSRVALKSIWFNHPRVNYVHSESNLGFGKAHNCAMDSCLELSELHLVLNPDIRLNARAISYLIERFEIDSELAVAMPAILYPDGTLQRLCKLLPTPLDLFVRRFLPIAKVRQWINHRYELYDLPQDIPSEVPSISGCFLLVKSSAMSAIGGFDDRFFMYMEDVDLVRRLALIGKVMYFPHVSVMHEYDKGSYRNPKLLQYHIISAVKYFNKWGWFIDWQRSKKNAEILFRLRTSSVFNPVTVKINTQREQLKK